VLEVEEELSTIESWRCGVEPSFIGDDDDEETVDVELMSPEADRALREKYKDELDPWDSVSQAERSTTRSHRSHRSHRSRRPRGEGEDVDIPDEGGKPKEKKNNMLRLLLGRWRRRRRKRKTARRRVRRRAKRSARRRTGSPRLVGTESRLSVKTGNPGSAMTRTRRWTEIGSRELARTENRVGGSRAMSIMA